MTVKSKNIIHTCLVLVLFSLCSSCSDFKKAEVKRQMVVAEEPLAAQIGLDVMNEGGNAIDAAIAVGFALAVTFPEAGNIGGGGFLVYRSRDGDVSCLDFRETAPLAAHSVMFLKQTGELVNNHIGIRTVGVPGTVAGLEKAHELWGSKNWKELVEPAVKLAKDGFILDQPWVDKIEEYASLLMKYPETASLLFKEDGSSYSTGELFIQKDLGASLNRIANQGAFDFYEGETADLIVSYMQAEGGLISKNDLKKYQAVERSPFQFEFNGFSFYSMPPPSSGGPTLSLLFKMAEVLDVDQRDTVSFLHFKAEIMRRAFKQRAIQLGDPDFNPSMRFSSFTSADSAQKYLKDFSENGAGTSQLIRHQHQFEGSETTHFSIVDKDGNAVSLTYTLEQNFGSKMTVPGAGFLLNNEMGDFNPKINLTDSFGRIGSLPNSIEPGKRMLSSMSPTIICKGERLAFVLGTRGGRTIINSVFQVAYNLCKLNTSLEMAVEAPRIHHQWFPDAIYYEHDRFSLDVLNELNGLGHSLKERSSLGKVMAIQNTSNGLIGIADSRAPMGAVKTN